MATTTASVSSANLNTNYALYDTLGMVASGLLTTNPTPVPVVTYTNLNDELTWYNLSYGYKFDKGITIYRVSEVEVYLAQEINPFISEINQTTVALYSGITIDKQAKLLTIDINLTAEELYDYMQYWQSLPANADTLVNGEIYSTFDGKTFNLSPAWSITKTGTQGVIYIAISAIDRTGLAVNGSNGLEFYSASFLGLEEYKASSYHTDDLVTLQKKYFVDCYKDGSPYVSTTGFTSQNAVLTSSAYFITYRSAIGDEHNGIPSNGVVWQHPQGYSNGYLRIAGFQQLLNLEVKKSGNSNRGIDPTEGALIDSCLVSNSTGEAFRAGAAGVGVVAQVRNCIAYNCSGSGFFAGSYSYWDLYNNIAYNCAIGFSKHSAGGADVSEFNNAAILCGTGFSGGNSSLTASNNSSTDNTASLYNSGSLNCIDNLIAEDAFINHSAINLHLKAGSPLIGAGADTSSYGVLKDIDGQPWGIEDGVPVPYSIGVDQSGAFTVPILIKCIDSRTNDPVSGVTVHYKAELGGAVTQGTTIDGGFTNVAGEYTYNMPFTGLQPISGKVRKGTTAPFYKTSPFSGTVNGDGLTITIYVTEET